jgi:hypothetical protein
MDFDKMMNFSGRNFDPTQPLPFDPSRSGYGNAVYKAQNRKQMAKLDFVFVSGAASNKVGAVVGNYNADPLSVLDSRLTTQTAVANCTTAGAFEFIAGGGAEKVTLTCNQLPYNTFWRATGTSAFHVSLLRVKASNTSQLDNSFTIRRQTMFGYDATQTIVISNFIDPDQNQANIVDIPTSVVIDAETGLYIDIDAGVTFTVSMFIDEFIKPASKDALSGS